MEHVVVNSSLLCIHVGNVQHLAYHLVVISSTRSQQTTVCSWLR